MSRLFLCLMAAGSARRFGSNKLLETYKGKPVWTYGYEQLKSVGRMKNAELVVVTRYDEIYEAVEKDFLDESLADNVVPVFCHESELGLSYTVRAAMDAFGDVQPEDKLLFFVADQPNVSLETIIKVTEVELAASIDGDGPLAACPSDGTTQGNPVVFSGCLFDALMSLTGDRGGKAVLKDYPDRLAFVECTSAELADIDSKEDLTKLK